MTRLGLGVALAAAALFSMPSVATAAEYKTFVGCDDLAENPIPSHVCQVGDFPGAFFESDSEVEVEICVEFPTSSILCTDPELAEAGILYVLPISGELEGDYFVTWNVEGEEVESWAFRVEPPPPVVPSNPAPAPSPAPVTSPQPVVTSSSPTPACRKARQRIRKLGRQLQNADGRQQKARIRGQLRNARTTARRAC